VPAPGLPGPLARLYETALRLGITVLEDAAAASRWPDENIAAIVSFGEHITLKPGLDDGLRTDVLAMALIIAAVMGDCPIGHPCAITAPAGLVMISQIRIPRSRSGPGKLATLLARKCGRDTASAAFEYTTPVSADASPWAPGKGDRLRAPALQDHRILDGRIDRCGSEPDAGRRGRGVGGSGAAAARRSAP
jgi:hypothetical protein